MRKAALLAVAALATGLASAPSVSAADYAVSFDLPLQYYQDEGDTLNRGDLGGATLGFNLGSSLFGIGVTVLDFDLPAERAQIRLLNAFVDLPVQLVNIRLGGGLGQVDYEPTVLDRPQDTTDSAHEVFLHVGLPIATVFDVHVGYHVIAADPAPVDGTLGGTPVTVDADGSGRLVTVGVKVGW